MQAVLLVLAILITSSCGNARESDGHETLADLAASNQAGLMKLQLGMSRDEVASVMGDKASRVPATVW